MTDRTLFERDLNVRINQDFDIHVYFQSYKGPIDGSDFKLQIIFVLRNYTETIIFRIFETSYPVEPNAVLYDRFL